MALGSIENSSPSTFLDGNIAEFWCANVDIQPDGGQLDETLLRQLAYGGPFSVPHIAKDIIEYRSFRKYPSSDGDEIGEVFHGAAGRQIWANTNGVTIGPHPPLPGWYAKPPNAIIVPPWRKQIQSYNVFPAAAAGGFFSRYYYDMNGQAHV